MLFLIALENKNPLIYQIVISIMLQWISNISNLIILLRFTFMELFLF